MKLSKKFLTSNPGLTLQLSDLSEILDNVTLTKHSLNRLAERRFHKLVDVETVKQDIEKNIYLAYINSDGSVNVAIDNHTYYVFAQNDNSSWSLVTFKEPSNRGKTVIYKQMLARLGEHL